MERSCTVNLLTQKQTLSWKGVALCGKELHCKPCYTKTNTFMESSCTVKQKTNTFMERSCTVNLLTQKQTLSWKGVAL